MRLLPTSFDIRNPPRCYIECLDFVRRDMVNCSRFALVSNMHILEVLSCMRLPMATSIISRFHLLAFADLIGAWWTFTSCAQPVFCQQRQVPLIQMNVCRSSDDLTAPGVLSISHNGGVRIASMTFKKHHARV